jgi:CrcB protein
MNSAAPFSLSVLWAVACGGALGSVSRYAIAQWLPRVSGGIPVHTLVVNIAGSFLIGLLARLLSTPGEHTLARAALLIGFCGGFTTFSAFSAEFVALVQEGRAGRAVTYVVTSVLVGVIAVVAGMTTGDRLMK